MRRILGALIAVVAIMGACGSDGGSTDGGGSARASVEPNEMDVEFAQKMIPHHRQAVEMAEMVQGATDRSELLRLADDIVADQDREIETMTAWLEDWDEEVPEGGMGMDHGAMEMPGMMSDQDMQALAELEGEAFELRFLEMMIEHHRGAIDMARGELEDGSLDEVKELARDVITAQEAEIRAMRKWQAARSR